MRMKTLKRVLQRAILLTVVISKQSHRLHSMPQILRGFCYPRTPHQALDTVQQFHFRAYTSWDAALCMTCVRVTSSHRRGNQVLPF
jgi:hypothetical protein